MHEKEIREKARELLESKKVSCVVGYRKTELPYLTRLVVIKSPDDVNRLTFNRFARYPTPTVLPKLKGEKVAIIAKGCDMRALNMLLAEKQIERKNIYVIGVSCPGLIDARKLRTIMPSVKEIEVSDKIVILKDDENKIEIKLEDVLYPSCLRCEYPTPSKPDILIGEPREGEKKDYEKLIGDFSSLSEDERWEKTEKEFTKCIRCYACRQVCPMCYCEECFVDQNNPKWLEGGLEKTDIMIWHLGRIYHMAGRCVDCGACSAVCPVGIDFSRYLLRIEKSVLERFDYKAGLDPAESPPLQTYKITDPEEFIL